MYVKKRNGSIVKFNLQKISTAMQKAFNATHTTYNQEILDLLSLKVVADFQSKVKDDIIDIEDIQDSVERILELAGFTEVAKAYILYRKQHEKIRELKKSINEFTKIVNEYVNQQDWRVKENSTVNYSIGGLILYNSNCITANYWLQELYDKEISDAHRNGDIHIHDLGMLAPYCAGWSLEQLIREGLNGVPGKVASAPAKHLSTLINQMINFLGILQNEWAGAMAFSSFDTYLAPFVKNDNLSYKDVKQAIQSFVFGVNTPSRWGCQPPFTNITLDFTVTSKFKNKNAIIDGKEVNFTYGECQKEMDMINKALLEVYLEGDANRRGFQYPIPTYNITKEFDWNNPIIPLLFELTAKYGTPYFQNFVNSELEPDDVRSMCCRLQLDKRELKRRGGGLFGSDEFTGSIGVVTINLPRIAYLSNNENEFFERLTYFMEIAKRSLEIKRRILQKLYEKDFFPYTKRYLKNFNNHFSTIGIVGGNEATLNAKWIKAPLYNEKARSFIINLLNFMRNKLKDFQEETGNLYNLEATPAESAAYRLAKIDKEKFPLIKTAGKKVPYYTNSTHLPVDYTDDVFEALDLQEELQTKYTGGTVFHCFVGEKISDWKVTMNLVKKIVDNYRLPYFTISPTYSICPNHGYISGEKERCPYCKTETEVYSRITGYYRPIKAWNDGKREEFLLRKEYLINREKIEKTKSKKKTTQDKLYFISINNKNL